MQTRLACSGSRWLFTLPRGGSNCVSLAHTTRRRPEDVAALAVDLMTNTAVTGATFNIDDGEQLVES